MENENRIARHVPGWLALFSLILTSCSADARVQPVNATPPAGQPAASGETLGPQNCAMIYVDPSQIDDHDKPFITLAPGSVPDLFCAQVSDPRQLHMPTTLVGIYIQQSGDGRTHLALGDFPAGKVQTTAVPLPDTFQELYPGSIVRLIQPLANGLTAVVDVRFGYSNGQEVTYAAVGTLLPQTSVSE